MSTTPTRAQAASAAVQRLPDLFREIQYGSNPERIHEHALAMIAGLQGHFPAVVRGMQRWTGNTMKPIRLVAFPDDLLRRDDRVFDLDDVALPADAKAAVLDLRDEYSRATELAAAGLSPRNRIVITGPPGNGKSMLAAALATLLDLPLLRVRYGGLVDSHLGATNRNVDKLMTYITSVPCLVFWDEFDSVAIARNHGSDIGEMRRVTNQLLLALDDLAPHTVLVAASNAQDLIDRAVMRRFDVHITIPAPSYTVAHACAARELCRTAAVAAGWDIDVLAERVVAAGAPNLSTVVDRAKRIRRDVVLFDGRGVHSLLASDEDRSTSPPETTDSQGT